MAVQTFRYVQQLMENYFDMIQTDKKKIILWSRRLHLALLAYRELLLTICVMDKSPDGTVRDSARVIKSNIFYILEYRELIITLLVTYNELKMSNAYLKDLMETQHVFVKLLEGFCGGGSSVVVQKKTKKRRRRQKPTQDAVVTQPDVNLESQWDEVSPQLSTVLQGNTDFSTDVVPFDAASDVPIDEQKADAMKNVQRKLRTGEYENAVSLLRAAREVWPENNCFGSNNMAPEEEFLALRDIFFADLGENDASPVVEEQPVYDENDEEEDPESEGEIDFKFEDFVKRLANRKVVQACGLALKDFETNSVNTNHCIIKLLHRIAFDSKLYVMIFQVSIFKTFQRIYANKDFPQYRELVKFATYVIREFVKITEINKKVYMECLFWKNSTEAYEIEHGYLTAHTRVAAAAWSEEEEDELRRLFMEHQRNQLEEDIVDWIVNNLIDNTRTRRGVLKKLKEMCLLDDYKRSHKSGVRIPQQWGDDEETQLRELYEEFKAAADPLDCITTRLDVHRSKRTVIQKLKDLGLIQTAAEVRKKRIKPGRASGGEDVRGTRESDSEPESNGSDDDDDDGELSEAENSSAVAKKTHTHTRSTIQKKTKTSKSRKTRIIATDSRIATLLVNVVNSGMSEALDWVKESLSDAVEDFENDDNCESIPLVPIMDYAVDAMENADFQETLRALGIAEPFDEQETYWRISADLSVSQLKKCIDMLQRAVDNTLNITESESSNSQQVVEEMNNRLQNVANTGGDAFNDDNSTEMNSSSRNDLIESDEEEQTSRLVTSISPRNPNKKMKNIIESDEEEEEINVSQPRTVRNAIESDEDDEAGPSVSSRVNISRKIIDDDSENEDKKNEDNDTKRSRVESDSDTEKPLRKRGRVISSDED